MKRSASYLLVLIAVACILVISNAQAQISHSTVGIKGGMNINHLSVSGLSDASNRIGYHVGAFARIGGTFAIQPEVLFATKGSVIHYDNIVAGGAIVSLKYLDVPVMGLLYLTDHLNLQAGPYFSYLINASAKNENPDQTDDVASNINKDDFKNMDYGLGAGVGFELGSLNFSVRYLQGLYNIFHSENNSPESVNFSDGKNSAWQVSVGLAFL